MCGQSEWSDWLFKQFENVITLCFFGKLRFTSLCKIVFQSLPRLGTVATYHVIKIYNSQDNQGLWKFLLQETVRVKM